jgi:SAM-dependent methyltransferase
MPSSTVCRYEHFHTDWYLRWAEILNLEPGTLNLEGSLRNISRKAWEWCVIAAVLEERGMLEPGRQGLGFAVGTEPLPSAFAHCGVSVLGTDLAADDAGWGQTGQHARSADHLFHPGLVDRPTFDRCVRFQPADMRDLGGLSSESVDFVWSSCSFEHLGSLAVGMQFVMDAMRLVRPGGLAVHTTEYNVGSNKDTWDTGGSVIYRKQDIEELGYQLRHVASALECVDFDAGVHRYDIEYDYPPYFKHGRKHVKLQLGPHISTSILLVIRKAELVPA